MWTFSCYQIYLEKVIIKWKRIKTSSNARNDNIKVELPQ
jgi:hypothetical protein